MLYKNTTGVRKEEAPDQVSCRPIVKTQCLNLKIGKSRRRTKSEMEIGTIMRMAFMLIVRVPEPLWTRQLVSSKLWILRTEPDRVRTIRYRPERRVKNVKSSQQAVGIHASCYNVAGSITMTRA